MDNGNTKEPAQKKVMTANEVVKIHQDLEDLGIKIIIDGGWGVDALLGEQTRAHKDIDFLIELKDVEKTKKYFLDKDFEYSTEEENTWWHFMLEKGSTEIDIHVIELDESGNGIYGPKEHGAVFPAEALTGTGSINGIEVNCLSADYRIHCLTVDYGIITRTGYELKNTDYIDVVALCNKFDIPIPAEFVEPYEQLQNN